MSVIITGAAKGIGKACVNHFLDEGYRVIALDMDALSLAQLKNDPNLLKLECDVTSENEVQKCINKGIEKLGEVEILVNNAGIVLYGSVVESSLDEWKAVMEVNLYAPFLLSKYCIPSMLKLGKGVIINVSSVQAFLSQKRVASYTSSKSGIIGLTRSIAVDFAPKIRCVAVCPGSVTTPMLKAAIDGSEDPKAVERQINDMHLVKRAANPNEIAAFIGYLTSEKAGFITGQSYRIDGGLGIEIGGN